LSAARRVERRLTHVSDSSYKISSKSGKKTALRPRILVSNELQRALHALQKKGIPQPIKDVSMSDPTSDNIPRDEDEMVKQLALLEEADSPAGSSEAIPDSTVQALKSELDTLLITCFVIQFSAFASRLDIRLIMAM
jgi:hypothetical protein